MTSISLQQPGKIINQTLCPSLCTLHLGINQFSSSQGSCCREHFCLGFNSLKLSIILLHVNIKYQCVLALTIRTIQYTCHLVVRVSYQFLTAIIFTLYAVLSMLIIRIQYMLLTEFDKLLTNIHNSYLINQYLTLTFASCCLIFSLLRISSSFKCCSPSFSLFYDNVK